MATARPVRENEQELRLALAMRGGASMAVWIGGATAEINCLRRVLAEDSSAAERAHPWVGLAKLAGYNSVTVDVAAGTSAGGLNASLLVASVIYGLPFDDMRSVWVRLADLEAMSRRVPKFWQPDPLSLLEGDDYFRVELVRTLKNFLSRADPAGTRHTRADLLLTATLLDPLVEQHFDGRGGTLAQERRKASFRFRHVGRPGEPNSDFGSGRDFDDTALRLAHAARATSSFPFAFEPARVYCGTCKPPAGEPDMFGLFSETTEQTRPFRVIDGGVLDNIPVAAAIRSIAEAPAARPTHRWLLYLNPEPAAPHDDRPFGRQFALPVVSTALQAKLTEESLLADIEALDEHNRGVERLRLTRRSLFAELDATPPERRQAVLAARAAAIEPEHAVVRTEFDAQAVYQMLIEPSGIEDGKLLPPVVGDPLEGWSGTARAELAGRLSARMAEQSGTDGVFDDARALLSAVQQCFSWVWDIERFASPDRLAEAGACKSALYRLRVFGVVLEGHADQYWINAAKQEPIVDSGEIDDWVDRVLRRRKNLQHRLPSPIRPLLSAVLDEVDNGARFERAVSEFAAELLSIVDSAGADAVADDHAAVDEPVDAVAEAMRVLHGIVDRIAAIAPEREEIRGPEDLGCALLETAEDRPAVLRRLVVLTAPLDVGRVPGSPINLLRVSGNQQTPLPFDALRETEDGPLWLDNKLRGGDLGNFAAFLSAKWRANDWMWGRLDATTSLIALLLDPRRLVRRNAEIGAGGVHDELAAIACAVTAEELGGVDEDELARWREFLTQRWQRRQEAVRAELDALFAESAGEHPLEETRRAMSERLHWTIVARELPYVAELPTVANEEVAERTPAVPRPENLSRDVHRYSVGRQRLADLGENRLATLATRFGLLAYRAIMPSGPGVLPWLVRKGMTLLKPLVMAVVLAIAAPRRAAAAGFLAAAALTLAGAVGSVGEIGDFRWAAGSESGERQAYFQESVSMCDPSTACVGVAGRETGPTAWLYDFSGDSYGPSVVVAMAFALLFAVWLGYVFVGHGRGLARWVPALVVGAALVAGTLWVMATGFRIGPVGLSLVLGLLTWFAVVAYRPSGRWLAALVTAVVCALVTTTDSWLPLTVLGIGYAQAILVGCVDVLRPRPRS